MGEFLDDDTGLEVVMASRPDRPQSTGSERRTTDEEQEINDTKQSAEYLAILEQLNNDYVHSDQFSSAKRFSELLGG